jgi:two-component system phosphate regulon sensor histidine kinase PhoR
VPPEVLAFVALLATITTVAVAAAITRQNALDRVREALDAKSGADLEPAVREALDKRAEAEFRAQQGSDDLAHLADLLGVGIVRVDDDLTVRLANRAAHVFLGRRQGALVGLSAMEAFVDNRIEAVVRSARETGSATGELTLREAIERIALVRARRSPVAGIWVVMEDITELRRLQRIRAEFIDNLSHELRTPLTTVRLLTETVVNDIEAVELPPRLRDMVQKIDVETGHLVQMVNELLDLSKIEQGTTQLHLDTVDIGAVVEASIERLRLFADRQGVVLRAELPPPGDRPLVRGDEERIGQLLVNLLHNAVKFSVEGGEVILRVRVTASDVVVSVVDRGVGIPKADLERVFERFYKVDRARVRGKGGTGLGLAIARHIAEGHGGRLSVESEEGRGSTFTVELPREFSG